MSYQITKEPSGLTIVTGYLKDRKSVSIGIWVRAGGRDETDEISGISHFLEHLVFKGTKRRSADAIKESVEGTGGALNAFTSEEHTCYLAKVTQSQTETALDVLADMVLEAVLPPEEIEKERGVIIEEIKMVQDQPSQYAEEVLTGLVWPSHPLGRPLAGTIESVRCLKRDQIVQYRNRFYQPPHILVCVAGEVDHDQVVKSVRKIFSFSQVSIKGPAVAFSKNQKVPQLRLVSKKTEQTHLALGFHGLSKKHPDSYRLQLLNILLGGNMSSRLFNEVREKRGLAYDIGSHLSSFEDTGLFAVDAGVDKSRFLDSLEVILKELKKAKESLVTADELRRAKDFYLGQLSIGLENTMDQMCWMGENMLTFGRIRTEEEIIENIQSVTREDLQRVASHLFVDSGLSLAVVGPMSRTDEKKIQECLTLS